MGNKVIACSHPGKMGDCLYSLPAVKELCRKHSSKCDFYTSNWCASLRPIFEFQPFIRRFIVDEEYVGVDYLGIHPVDMDIPEGYDRVYQLGFRVFPDRFLPDFICNNFGLEKQPLKLEIPEMQYHGGITIDGKSADIHKAFLDVLIDGIGKDTIDVGNIRLNTLKAATHISGSRVFIGIPSFPLALASFIPGIVRVVLTHERTCVPHLLLSECDIIVPVSDEKEETAVELAKILKEWA